MSKNELARAAWILFQAHLWRIFRTRRAFVINSAVPHKTEPTGQPNPFIIGKLRKSTTRLL